MRLITSLHICQNTHVCRPLLRVSCVYHGFEHLALHVLLIALLVDAGFPYNVQRWAYVLGMRPAMGQAGWKEIRDGAFFYVTLKNWRLDPSSDELFSQLSVLVSGFLSDVFCTFCSQPQSIIHLYWAYCNKISSIFHCFVLMLSEISWDKVRLYP